MNTPEISTDELQQMIDNKSFCYVLIDVREEEELHHGMLPTACHLPLGDIAEDLGMKPEEFEKEYNFTLKNKEVIIFYCRTGSRSEQATLLAREAGLPAVNYKGSVLEWSKFDKNVNFY